MMMSSMRRIMFVQKILNIRDDKLASLELGTHQ